MNGKNKFNSLFVVCAIFWIILACNSGNQKAEANKLGNVISGQFFPSDIGVQIFNTGTGTLVQNNYIGSNPAVRQILPQNINAVNIERGETDDQTVRSNILSAINNGQKILTYVGHGSTAIWRGNIFTKSDAANLTNSGKLPIFVTMTCLNGFFQDAVNNGLSETLLKNPNGGAVAVWTSTGAGLPDTYSSLNVEIHRQLFGGATLGEVHLRAKRTIANQDVLRTFVLLGDPSMRLR